MKKTLWEEMIERGEKIRKLEREAYIRYDVKYLDKENGKPINGIPKKESPLKVNRGFCVNCSKIITESVGDDRYCNKCFKSLFPAEYEVSRERFYEQAEE